MKKIIKPAEREEAVYYSDFTGKCFGEYEPEAELLFNFQYGSKYDGEKVSFHLSDTEAEAVLEFIKSKISKERRTLFEQKLHEQNTNLKDAVQARDCTQADVYNNSCDLFKFLLR